MFLPEKLSISFQEVKKQSTFFSLETKQLLYYQLAYFSLIVSFPFLLQSINEDTVWLSAAHLELLGNLRYLQVILYTKGIGLGADYPAKVLLGLSFTISLLAFEKARNIDITDQS